MAKKIEIDIEVNSKSVVDAKNNVDGLNTSIKNTETTTQDFGNKVKIEYDKAGKATNVLVDTNISLTKQVRAVREQMQILTGTGKAQSQEFTILQRKYNDLNDNLSKNKARSQELFGTLSLLPGPVGAFSSQLQGGIDLLKTFSGYKLSDIKNQFVGLKNDIKEVFQSFGGFDKAKEEIDKKYAKTTTSAGNAGITGADTTNTNLNTGAEEANTTATLQNAQAQLQSSNEKLVDAQSTEIDTLATEKNTLTTIENSIVVKTLALEYVNRRIAILNDAAAIGDNTGAQELNILTQRQSVIAQKLSNLETQKSATLTKIQTIETKAAAVASEGKAVALSAEALAAKEAELASARLAATWKGIASATVIGAIILGIIKIISLLSEMYFETEKNTKIFKLFAEGLKLGSQALDDELVSIQNYTRERIAILKKQNADGKVIRDEEIAGIKKQQEAIRREIKSTDQDVESSLETYMSFKGGLKNKLFMSDEAKTAYEQYQAALEKLRQLKLKDNQISSDITIKGIENNTATTQEGYAKDLAELDAKIQLEIDKERTNTVELSKLLEERAVMVIDHDKYKEKQAELLRQQNKKKSKDAGEEDQKRVETYLNKIGQITLQSIENQQTKELALREEKYNQDRKDLMREEEFIKSAQEDKNRLLLELEETYQTDVRKMKLQYALETSQLAFNAELDSSIKHFDLLRKIEEDNYNLQYDLAKGNLQKQELLKKEYAKKLIDIDIQELQSKSNFLKESADLENENYKQADGRFFKSFKTIKEMYDRKYQDLRDAEKSNYEAEQKAAGDNEGALELARKKHNQVMLDLLVSEKEDRQQVLRMMTDATAKFGQDLSTIGNVLMQEKQGRDKKAFESGKKIAIAGVLLEKAAAIGQIWENNAVANAKATAAFPLTFGQPWVTINTVTAAVSTAATIAAAAQAVSGINGTDFNTSTNSSSPSEIGSKPNYGDGGMIDGPRHAEGGVAINAEGGEAVMTRGAVTMFKPLLSMMNQVGGGTSFTKGASGQSNYDNPKVSNPVTEQQIIKTYVVEQDLTSVQHRNARLKDLSTL